MEVFAAAGVATFFAALGLAVFAFAGAAVFAAAAAFTTSRAMRFAVAALRSARELPVLFERGRPAPPFLRFARFVVIVLGFVES